MNKIKQKLDDYLEFVETWYSSNDISLNIEHYRDKKIEDIIS